MNLIIVCSVSCDEGLYFRYITMMAKTELRYDVLLEAEQAEKDYYYHYLKKRGWFDYVDDIVPPDIEKGVRIDTELTYPHTIQTPYIRCENTPNILGQLKSLRSL